MTAVQRAAVRTRVRRHTYRGRDGWLLEAGRARVFFDHESSAHRTREKYRADPDYFTTLEDFEP